MWSPAVLAGDGALVAGLVATPSAADAGSEKSDDGLGEDSGGMVTESSAALASRQVQSSRFLLAVPPVATGWSAFAREAKAHDGLVALPSAEVCSPATASDGTHDVLVVLPSGASVLEGSGCSS